MCLLFPCQSVGVKLPAISAAASSYAQLICMIQYGFIDPWHLCRGCSRISSAKRILLISLSCNLGGIQAGNCTAKAAESPWKRLYAAWLIHLFWLTAHALLKVHKDSWRPNAQTDPNAVVVGWWVHCWWLAANRARCWHFCLIRSHSAASSDLWKTRNSPTHI